MPGSIGRAGGYQGAARTNGKRSTQGNLNSTKADAARYLDEHAYADQVLIERPRGYYNYEQPGGSKRSAQRVIIAGGFQVGNLQQALRQLQQSHGLTRTSPESMQTVAISALLLGSM